MAKVLGIDIVGSWLYAAEVSGSAGSPASRAIAAKLPSELSVAKAEELGAWLKEQLAAAGIRASDATLVLGRNFTSLKSLRLPLCPDNELPAMVAFSAAEEDNGLAPGEQTLDFQSTRSGEECEVLAAQAPAALVDACSALAKAAGLNLASLSLRPYAMGFAWDRLAPADVSVGATMFVVLSDELLELSVWSGDRVALCRSIPIGGHDDHRRVGAEVRRTLAAYQAQASLADVVRLVVVGPDQDSLAKSLQTAINREAIALEPAKLYGGPSLQDAGRLAPAVGAAWRQLAGADWPIDFLNPKKPIVIRDSRKSVGVMVACLALAIPLGAFGYAGMLLRQRDARIATQNTALAQINAELKELEPVMKRHRAVADWTNSEVVWLDELRELSTALPDTTDAYVVRWDGISSPGNKTATVKIEGRARQQQIVNQTQTRWAQEESGHYRVVPRGMEPGADSSDFPWRFELDLAVDPLTTKEYAERAKEAAAKRLAMETPKDKIRVPASFGVPKVAAPAPTVAESKPASAEPDKPPASAADAKPSAGSGSTSSTSTPSNDSSDDSDSEPEDPVSKLVKRIKALPYEEREEEIKKAPRFLQSKIREALQEAK